MAGAVGIEVISPMPMAPKATSTPGFSTKMCIRDSFYMVKPAACAGVLEGNPLREDLEDALNCCPVDFIVNAVLDEHKKIVHCVCGDAVSYTHLDVYKRQVWGWVVRM